MNILIFAGGAGTRLWPLSRQNSPKQFSVLKDSQSTLQMTMERLKDFGSDHIFLATNDQYKDLVRQQAPEIPPEHIFTEPARRDLAAAVGLALVRLHKLGLSGPTAILWSDHFVEKPAAFAAALRSAEEWVQSNSDKIVFFGEKPRFANHNLGWIKIGPAVAGGDNDHRIFLGWRYRPEKSACDAMFASGEWLWNPGYFVFDLDTMLGWYRQFQPDLLAQLERCVTDNETLKREYENVPAMHFDEAIIEKIPLTNAVVMPVSLGWSDPGTLYALKEALAPGTANFTKGKILMHHTADSFAYNEEEHKIMAVVGLDGVVVVNTPDAILVCHKDSVPEIKNVLHELEEKGDQQFL